eukprot:TRINITY_DN3876_c0_g1_i1.p1 TRINITY_DN3876_c0_g1~~TRINITY_DN3876_c0_g1_i1.p1  ORF type:complete len:432 (+),score=132.97 TRINITY_DN3876_c0_g1_i1:828-2123(+)
MARAAPTLKSEDKTYLVEKVSCGDKFVLVGRSKAHDPPTTFYHGMLYELRNVSFPEPNCESHHVLTEVNVEGAASEEEAKSNIRVLAHTALDCQSTVRAMHCSACSPAPAGIEKPAEATPATDKPAEQPAEQSAAKPVEKPAAKPAEKPAAKPVTSFAAAAAAAAGVAEAEAEAAKPQAEAKAEPEPEPVEEPEEPLAPIEWQQHSFDNVDVYTAPCSDMAAHMHGFLQNAQYVELKANPRAITYSTTEAQAALLPSVTSVFCGGERHTIERKPVSQQWASALFSCVSGMRNKLHKREDGLYLFKRRADGNWELGHVPQSRRADYLAFPELSALPQRCYQQQATQEGANSKVKAPKQKQDKKQKVVKVQSQPGQRKEKRQVANIFALLDGDDDAMPVIQTKKQPAKQQPKQSKKQSQKAPQMKQPSKKHAE